MEISHHGAVDGVTGSCHQLHLPGGESVLVDCGLFQGAETSADGRAAAQRLEIGFAIEGVRALVLTHVHVDHVGRLPFLLAAGYEGPIVCSLASAQLLPLVIADALEVGVTRERRLIERVLDRMRRQLVPIDYGQWHALPSALPTLRVRLQPAGHILGSAYVELDLRLAPGRAAADRRRIVFSGDLGAPWTPLLAAPRAPLRADVVVLESTYGDREHEDRRTRTQRLQAIVERALRDRGTVLVPAFSIGRTQELLYELEEIIHRHRKEPAAAGVPWGELDVIVDSPLATAFNAAYLQLRGQWDKQARRKLAAGRQPLAFERLVAVSEHENHLRLVQALAQSARPAIVIAASGMCSGGRIVDYLKAMLPDPRHDVLFCGYQAAGTPGRAIQQHGPKGGWVELDGQRIDIRAGIHTLGGFSAHADRRNLLDFIGRMRFPPRQVRLVHGDAAAKQSLAEELRRRHPGMDVVIP